MFDGHVPQIKLRTIAQRKSVKASAALVAETSKRDKVKVRLQKLALDHVLGKAPPQPVENRQPDVNKEDMFYLEPGGKANLHLGPISDKANLVLKPCIETTLDAIGSPPKFNFMSQRKDMDPLSAEFKLLPADVQHELLLDHIEEKKLRAKTLSYNANTSSHDFSQCQIDNLMSKNTLNCQLQQVRQRLRGDVGEEGSVQVMKSGNNSEIVFTKLMNNSQFSIVDTRGENQEEEEKFNRPTTPSIVNVEVEPPQENIKNLLFGSDSDSAKSDVSDSEEPFREVKNVLGLSRGHPGNFVNPYNPTSSSSDNKSDILIKQDNRTVRISRSSDGMPKDSSDTKGGTSTHNVSRNEVYEISSSSESDFEDVTNIAKVTDDIKEVSEEVGLLTHAGNSLLFKDNISLQSLSASPQQQQQQLVTEVVAEPTTELTTELTAEHKELTTELTTELTAEHKEPNTEPISTTEPNTEHKEPTAEPHTEPNEETTDDTERANRAVVGERSHNDEDIPLLKSLIGDIDSEELDLETLNSDLGEELVSLQEKHRKAMSVSDVVSKGIVQDVQQLLSLFGVPYLTAPGEAEAQCAELCNLGLCDGVITDDSDVFLFGEVTVYRNLFKKNKDTQRISSRDILSSLSLDRNSLVEMAQLLGSDYCSGIRGIGPVAALNIISRHKTLQAFLSQDKVDKRYQRFDFSHLPDRKVANAYLEPTVTSSTEEFTWCEPNVPLLKDFLLKKLGWNSKKVDETLQPVLSNRTNGLITNFFKSRPINGTQSIVEGEQSPVVGKQSAKAKKQLIVARKQFPIETKKRGRRKEKKQPNKRARHIVQSEESESD